MFMYAAVRLLGAVLTFWLAVTLTFFGLRAAFAQFPPGSSLFGSSGSPSQVYIVEGSALEQYLAFLSSAVRWDWGYSMSAGQSVGQVLASGFPVTARIGLFAFLLAAGLGVPLERPGSGSAGRPRPGCLDGRDVRVLLPQHRPGDPPVRVLRPDG
ncbi:MAG: hypothetical protein WKH64_18195 [Chloroflexia bacterium]